MKRNVFVTNRLLGLALLSGIAPVLLQLQGAQDPVPTPVLERDREAEGSRSLKGHWAFRKAQRPSLPAVRQADWVRNSIDLFILARLEEHGLGPSPEADRYTLIRRLSLDLTGLPPTPGEVEAFIADASPEAYERLVDRLLASPAYGERWARVWLDLARYADSKGYGSDPLRPYMWRYRDWVIDAFNRNMPFDQFTIEQLAGDLLPAPSTDQLLATCFHRNTMANDEGGTDDEEFRVAAVKDRVDTTAQVWMGLTLGCAKCHSHKYDPITQHDYYSFYALFNQTQDNDSGNDDPRVPTPSPEQRERQAQLRDQLASLQAQLARPTNDLGLAQRRWEQQTLDTRKEWVVLAPSRAETVAGSALAPQEDQSLLATGPLTSTNTYQVEVRSKLQGVTAFRLEILAPTPGEPIGLGPDGNFVLNEFRVSAEPAEPKLVEGRFVRVEIPGPKKILSLAEVEVFHGSTNLARAGQATQSSTDYDGPAALAIDGNRSGDYNARSVTHTAISDDPWWEVDLQQTTAINRLSLWNRTDNNLENRLSQFRVRILNDERQPVWEQTVAESPRPSLTLSLSGPRPVPLRSATASFAQEGHPIVKAIDAELEAASGWAVFPETRHAHEAVFQTASPAGFPEGTTFRFHLLQSHGEGALLRRFRLSATTAVPPSPALPLAVREALAAAPAQRSPEQRQALSAYYWTVSPEYKALEEGIAHLRSQLDALEKEVVRTPVMRELAPEKQRVTRLLLKGNFLTPGDEVQPAVLGFLAALPPEAPTNRLGLARWLVQDDHPLTARVAVNRFWAILFGQGLVSSEEDFGTQGVPPTHPALLDWLATEFVGQRWDVKRLLKTMVVSATYRQSARVSPELLEKDPGNLWLGRAPRIRLEAEMVRDQALALAGLLSGRMYGPSVYPPQPPNLWQAAFNGQRTWPDSTGPDRYRRALYTFWRRTVPYPSMVMFDAPSREYCSLRRVRTSTPLQAFVTLNDPVYVEAAQALARRLVREGGSTVAARIEFGLRLCLARPPADEQVSILGRLFESELAHFRADPTAAQALAGYQADGSASELDAGELAAWTVVANVLLNLDGVLTRS